MTSDAPEPVEEDPNERSAPEEDGLDTEEPEDPLDPEDPSSSEALSDERVMERLEEVVQERIASLAKLGGERSIVILGGKVTGNTIAAGNVTSGAAGEGFAVGWEPPREQLDALRRTHVPPSGFLDLADKVEEHHLLVLRSRKGWGGTTAAIRLLMDESDKIVQISGIQGPLSSLSLQKVKRRSGLVVEGLSREQIAELGSGSAERLSAKLRERECKAVIVVDQANRIADHRAGGMSAELRTHPRPQDIVEKHLAELLGSRERARALAEELAETVQPVVDDRFDAHLLVALAHELVKVDEGIADIGEVLGNFTEWVKSDVEKWFDDRVDDDLRLAQALSQAVLDGFSYEAIQRAVERLFPRLSESGPPSAEHRRRPRERRSERLRDLRARISTEPGRGRRSQEVKVASFVDESYSKQILDHVLEEYPELVQDLLTWLQELVDAEEAAVAVRAATVLGYLGRTHSPRTCEAIIARWAASPKPLKQDLAVVALGMMAAHADTFASTARLVDMWTRSGSRSLRCTAARALGAGVGTMTSAEPDAALAALALGADRRLSLLIGRSMRDLFVRSGTERRVGILETLKAWAEEPAVRRRLAGVAGFLWCSRARVVLEFNGESVRWPLILVLGSTNSSFERNEATGAWDYQATERLRKLTADLLALAAGAPGMKREVEATIRGWVSDADQHPYLLREIEAVFTTAEFRSPRQARNLAYYRRQLPSPSLKLQSRTVEEALHA